MVANYNHYTGCSSGSLPPICIVLYLHQEIVFFLVASYNTITNKLKFIQYLIEALLPQRTKVWQLTRKSRISYISKTGALCPI